MRLSVLFLLAFSASAFAADVPEIRLPKIEQSKPDPTPKPVTKLGKGHWYVIDSDIPLLVLASPQGLVSTHKDAGPIRLRGLFADGKGEIETREYKGKEVWSIEAEKSGRVELLIVKAGTVDPAEVIRVTLDVDAGEGPRPPPDEEEDDKPEPKPVPDHLRDAVQAVYGADGSATKADDKAKLTAVYRSLANSISDPAVRTAGNLATLISDARTAAVGMRLAPLREILGEDFGKYLPDDTDAALTPEQKTKAAERMRYYANILEAIK